MTQEHEVKDRSSMQVIPMEGRNNPLSTAVQDDSAEVHIDLAELFWRILSRWYIVVLAALVGMVIGGVYAFRFLTPSYSATAKIYIVSSDTVINMADLQIGSALTADYTEVFSTWEVTKRVKDDLNLPYTQAALRNMLTVSNPSNSRVLYLTVVSHNAKEAADIANAYAEAGREFIQTSMSSKEPNIFSVARVNTTPVSRGKAFYLMIGFLLGTMLSLIGLLIDFLQDDRPRGSDDVTKHTGLPVLGVIPVDSSASKLKTEKKGAKR